MTLHKNDSKPVGYFSWVKEVKDNFSKQSTGYSRFRPVYPQDLYSEILSHLAELDTCWDCATGNGQIASVLASSFKQILASDISKNQLKNAVVADNVEYVCCRAESTPFADNSFDLITVGQAVHWFDHQHFNDEVQRVAKDNAVIALIGYGLMFVEAEFDRLLWAFYTDVLGDYWDPERRFIDEGYRNVPFPFEEIPLRQEHSIKTTWNRSQLVGYLRTWSSVVRYIDKNGVDPVEAFESQLIGSNAWSDMEEKEVTFPLFVKLGRIVK